MTTEEAESRLPQSMQQFLGWVKQQHLADSMRPQKDKENHK